MAVVGGVAGGAVWLAAIQQPPKRPAASSAPAATVREEPRVRLTAQSRVQAEAVITRFVQTAVLRRDLEVAWGLASAAMRKGVTHAEWLSGSLPGVFPVTPADYAGQDVRLLFAHPGEAVFDVVVIPKQTSAIGPVVSTVWLTREGGKWLVDAWGTRAMLPGASARAEGPWPTRTTATGSPEKPSAGLKGKLSPLWLVVPGIVFALIVLVPLALYMTNRGRERRAARRWEREGRRG